jgi:polyisoprenoid-binding protein YceI
MYMQVAFLRFREPQRSENQSDETRHVTGNTTQKGSLVENSFNFHTLMHDKHTIARKEEQIGQETEEMQLLIKE